MQAGLAVPSLGKMHNESYTERLASEEGYKEAEEKVQEGLKQAQAQYEYKFSAP